MKPYEIQHGSFVFQMLEFGKTNPYRVINSCELVWELVKAVVKIISYVITFSVLLMPIVIGGPLLVAGLITGVFPSQHSGWGILTVMFLSYLVVVMTLMMCFLIDKGPGWYRRKMDMRRKNKISAGAQHSVPVPSPSIVATLWDSVVNHICIPVICVPKNRTPVGN